MWFNQSTNIILLFYILFKAYIFIVLHGLLSKLIKHNQININPAWNYYVRPYVHHNVLCSIQPPNPLSGMFYLSLMAGIREVQLLIQTGKWFEEAVYSLMEILNHVRETREALHVF